MKRIADFLFSAGFMAVVLIVFAFSIAAATFVENDFGPSTARALVYNAHWFEFLLLAGTINLAGRIIRKKLYTRKKLPIFLFHAAFILILCGSLITRYTGWEGTLSVREGHTADNVVTDKAILRITSAGKPEMPLFLKSLDAIGKSGRNFSFNKTQYRIRVKSFIANAYRTIRPSQDGSPMAEFIYADSAGRKSALIEKGQTVKINNLKFLFSDTPPDTTTISLSSRGDSLFFTSPFPVVLSGMGTESFTILRNNEPHYFSPGVLYRFRNQVIVLGSFLSLAETEVRSIGESMGQTYDAVVLELSGKDFKKEVVVMGKAGYTTTPERVKLKNGDLLIYYGSDVKKIPFELKLNDFRVERYPGSRSPSSFESRVTLIDSSRNIMSDRKIYMNNILKYRGYRFYQSSYDPDEKGTILSVNHDLAGTTMTYAGYIIMTAGMILSLFTRDSRFRQLVSKRSKAQKITVLLLLLVLPGISFAQRGDLQKVKPVDPRHALIFSRMLIQNNDGRIEPAGTLSSEVLRKLLRDNSYKGMNADQVVLGMMSDPSVWQYEPIIRVSNAELRDLLGSKNKYFSFAGFFRNNAYILDEYVNGALRKKPVQRSKFDTEVIKIDEKINICYMIFTGDMFRIFPVPGDSTHTWYNHTGIKGLVTTEDSVFTSNIINLYSEEVKNSLVSGNWTNPDRILNAIAQYQKKYSPRIIPKQTKVTAEILLNRSDVFSRISKYYGIVGFVLLVLQFLVIFFRQLKLKVPMIIGIILIIILFCAHTAGLITRWYVSGYAPLSNGYEALTYVGWAAVLAGLIFAWRWPVTLSVASVLASLILFVAHLSWMDPQITTLVPVLKSYWLVIHVATITASYAFLGMAALMAFMNLGMMAFHSGTNQRPVSDTITEFTDIIEIALTVGLYLLTIGVFLGAVWANESWGRYWGWDPKETWALVTVLVYAFILHMRMIPGLKSVYTFNLASLAGFSSVIMTYFGVNYYLSGLHSYAKGDPLPVPSFVYYTAAVIIITAVAAYRRRMIFGSRQ